jgi:hypothetical protein
MTPARFEKAEMIASTATPGELDSLTMRVTRHRSPGSAVGNEDSQNGMAAHAR